MSGESRLIAAGDTLIRYEQGVKVEYMVESKLERGRKVLVVTGIPSEK